MKPKLDEESKALLDRAQKLLDSGNLTETQTADLTGLVHDMMDADSQDHLDDLAEALLDLLFDLE